MNMIERSDDEKAAFSESVRAELISEVEGCGVPEGLIKAGAGIYRYSVDESNTFATNLRVISS